MLTPSAVKRYLMEHHQTTLQDLATHFDASPAATRDVVAQWEQKGKVRSYRSGSCGKANGGCSCQHKASEIFEWVS